MSNSSDSLIKNRWIILFNVVLMTFMSCLDSSIVNVALPVMANKLGVTMASIEWVVTSYLIVISSTILIFGRLGDIKGKTTIFKFGIILFTIGSLLCGITNSLGVLVIARIVQAIGAAATMSTSQGIITHVFPSNERGRALGVSGTFVALGTMVGPPLGGFIISLVSWKYIFLINLPIGVFTFFWATKNFPKDVSSKVESFDLKGAALFNITVIALICSLTFGQHLGYTSPVILLGFIISIFSFALFIIVERKLQVPLLDLKIFHNPLFSLSIFCAFTSFIAIGASNIMQPFYLQNVLKLPPEITGLFMMVYPLILSIVAPISGYLSDRIGSELLTFLGLIFTSTGLFLMSTLNQYSSPWVMIGFVAIMSIGNGLFQSPNNSLVMSTVPKHKLGIAGSVNALIRNLGMVIGVSLSTSILYNRMSYKIGYPVFSYVSGREDIFVFGMTYVYITAASICALGAVLTAVRLYGSKNKKKLSAESFTKDIAS